MPIELIGYINSGASAGTLSTTVSGYYLLTLGCIANSTRTIHISDFIFSDTSGDEYGSNAFVFYANANTTVLTYKGNSGYPLGAILFRLKTSTAPTVTLLGNKASGQGGYQNILTPSTTKNMYFIDADPIQDINDTYTSMTPLRISKAFGVGHVRTQMIRPLEYGVQYHFRLRNPQSRSNTALLSCEF